MKKGITSHTVVRNEDRFIWFVLHSVLDFVDQMLVFDTGSTDATTEIIKSIKTPKIVFEQKGEVDADEIVKLRQEQLNRTNTEWFLILDGDEIWWKDSIRQVKRITEGSDDNLWGIVNPTINCVGDIFHYQEKQAGKYEFKGLKGHFAVRLIKRTLPGLHIQGTHPLEGYKDSQNKLITEYDEHLVFLDKPYLHLTNLNRSTTGTTKVISREKKFELGIPFPKDFRYPEVFYKKRPKFIPSPWVKAGRLEKARAAIQTPVKKLKRRILK